MATAEDKADKARMNDQLREYISQWRDEREKEEAELKRLKEKQAARKEIRAEQDKKQAAQKKAEEDRIKKEETDKKEVEALAKKKLMEDAERKRQEMLAAQKEGGKGGKQAGPAMDARKEMSKSKEQVEEEMKISLSIRIKPLALDAMDSDELKQKANQIWSTIATLEIDKYDYEQRQLDQDYEFKELAERQKLQLRNKAIKKGLDPESLTGSHPPLINMFSKYERRTDTRTYGDRKKLYEGGAEVIRAEWLETTWKEKFNEFAKRTAKKLPKWFGERPGRKAGDPNTPEGEEEQGEEAAEAEEEFEDYDEDEDCDEEEEEEEE